MKRKINFIAAISVASLALAACGSENVENTPVDDIDEIVEADYAADDAYPVGGALDAEQQARYDAMDRDAIRVEYEANRKAMEQETGSGGTAPESGTSSDSGSSASSGEATDANASSASGDAAAPTSRPRRSAMTFDYLDRNDDGKLSVAEYAIWALPVSPEHNAPNDQGSPELTSEQINDVGKTFFYFDQDGSTYLSETEFTQARNSSRAPS